MKELRVHRSYRFPRELAEALEARAMAEGLTISDLVVGTLFREYVTKGESVGTRLDILEDLLLTINERLATLIAK